MQDLKITYTANISIVVHSDRSINNYAVVACHRAVFCINNMQVSDNESLHFPQYLNEMTMNDLQQVKAKLVELETIHQEAVVREFKERCAP